MDTVFRGTWPNPPPASQGKTTTVWTRGLDGPAVHLHSVDTWAGLTLNVCVHFYTQIVEFCTLALVAHFLIRS